MQLDEAVSVVAQHRLEIFRQLLHEVGKNRERALRRLTQALTLVKNAAMAQAEFKRQLQKHLAEAPAILGPHLPTWRVHYAYSNIGITGARRAHLHAQIDVLGSSRQEAILLVQALCKKERRVFRRVIRVMCSGCVWSR